MEALKRINLRGKTAIITGATRGIGKQCARDLAARGCNIVVAAKTTEPQPTLPGTIYSVADELQKDFGVGVLPFKVDIRNVQEVDACVAACVEKFDGVDILINNASALWWMNIVDTPMNRYDLMNEINARGTFAMTRACLPHMAKKGWGRVINMSPPIDLSHVGGHTAYYISKFGMTLVALGVAQEYKGKGITAHTLWPKTVVESYASINFKMGTPSMWRKATILSDCVLMLTQEPDTFTGEMLIDEEYLRSRGWKDADFIQYRCDPEVEPPSMAGASKGMGFTTVRGRAADAKL